MSPNLAKSIKKEIIVSLEFPPSLFKNIHSCKIIMQVKDDRPFEAGLDPGIVQTLEPVQK